MECQFGPLGEGGKVSWKREEEGEGCSLLPTEIEKTRFSVRGKGGKEAGTEKGKGRRSWSFIG